jgi:hypothetical protein
MERMAQQQLAAAALASGPSPEVIHELDRQREQIDAWISESASAAVAAARLLEPAHAPTWLNELTRELRELPKRTRDELQALAARGWYLDPNMVATGPSRIRKAINEGQIQ